MQQESELVNSSIDSGQVKPVGENVPNLAAVSAVTKMESLNISSSTSVGCSKSEELPKDRFTRVKIYLTSSTMQLLHSKDM